jgi:hypothetical protein
MAAIGGWFLAKAGCRKAGVSGQAVVSGDFSGTLTFVSC